MNAVHIVRQAEIDINALLRQNQYVVDPDPLEQRQPVPQATPQDFFSHFSKWVSYFTMGNIYP